MVLHRCRQVVVGGLDGLLVEFHRLGVVLLLDGDVALQAQILGVDERSGLVFFHVSRIHINTFF